MKIITAGLFIVTILATAQLLTDFTPIYADAQPEPTESSPPRGGGRRDI
jgi:hypothetical protein